MKQLCLALVISLLLTGTAIARPPVVVTLSEQPKFVIPVLMYHRVSNTYSGPISKDLTVTPELFQRHLTILKARGYQTVTFRDILGNQEPFQALLFKKTVVLTFDDGRDCHAQVAQMLEDRGMKGVFFVPYGLIGGGSFLKEEQVKRIAQYHEIGSHTINHPNLPKLKDKELWKELYESKIALEWLIGQRIISIAYPFGAYSEQVVRATQAAGYLYGRTTDERIDWSGYPSLRIPIVYIHHNTTLEELR